MSECQGNKTITPPPETQREIPLQHSNESTDDAIEAVWTQQIGQALRQASLLASFADSLHAAQQYNLGTPVTAEALLFALWAMGNHLTNTCDQLRTLISTLPVSRQIIPSNAVLHQTVDELDALVTEVMEMFL